MGVLDALLDSPLRERRHDDALSEGFEENLHPRDFLGRFKKKVASLKAGETAELPDGHRVTRVERRTGKGEKFSQYLVAKPSDRPGTASGISPTTPERAAEEAANLSARSEHPKSIGGAESFRDVDAAARMADARKRNADADAKMSASRRGPQSDNRRAAANAANAPAASVASAAGRSPERRAQLAKAAAEAAPRNAIRDKLAEMPRGQRYSVVNGRGNPVGHVEKKADGYEVVLPKGIRTYATPGGAALAVDAYERQAKASELRRQGERRANIERMESNRRSRSRGRG